MIEDLEKAWRDIIIDHSQFPRHHGQLEDVSHQGHGENPFCGDRVQVQMCVDDSGQISDISVSAVGCAISLASASLLSSSLADKDVEYADRLFRRVHQLMVGETSELDPELGELAALTLVKRYPSRVKCATLAWHALKNALHGENGTVTTE